MKLLMLFLFCSLFFSFQLQATLYLPLSHEKQLSEADGVVRGTVVSQSYKRDHIGDVVTEVRVHPVALSGISSHQLINKNEFAFTLPGGEWDGVTYAIDGIPTFQKGEDVLLLIKKNGGSYSLSNLGLGKYQIVKRDGEEKIISAVFPYHSKISQISLKSFEKLIIDRFQMPLAQVAPKESLVTSKVLMSKSDIERAPASLSEKKIELRDEIDEYWLVILLALLGLMSTYLYNVQVKRK